METDGNPIKIERKGAARWVVIDREARRNAINEAVIRGISEGLREAESDPDCRAVVLTGAGDRAFCAGADLNPSATGKAFEYDFSDPHHFVVNLFRQVEAFDLPIVARVNGHVRAGGMGLLCMCDMAVASDAATFGTPESSIGIFPMMILPYMMRVMPRRKLLEMCITGEAFSAQEAMEMDLLNYVVPAQELDAKTEWLVDRIASKSPTAVKLGKNAFHAAQDMALQEAFSFTEAYIRPMTMTEDAREGIQSFVEKRTPKWTGR